jgi:hypothetical protein
MGRRHFNFVVEAGSPRGITAMRRENESRAAAKNPHDQLARCRGSVRNLIEVVNPLAGLLEIFNALGIASFHRALGIALLGNFARILETSHVVFGSLKLIGISGLGFPADARLFAMLPIIGKRAKACTKRQDDGPTEESRNAVKRTIRFHAFSSTCLA